MELFDKKFVHFIWDDELVGKKCFVKDCIDDLADVVERGDTTVLQEVEYSGKPYSPFQLFCDGEHFDYVFAYYDPNYEVKKAFNEGKKVQMKVDGFWANCDNPDFEDGEEYRVKPEEKEYRPYINSAEMIADFIDRFKVDCPPYEEPLVWVKDKTDGIHRFFIWGFHEEHIDIGGFSVPLDQLFERYTYLDGSPCGMEAKE